MTGLLAAVSRARTTGAVLAAALAVFGITSLGSAGVSQVVSPQSFDFTGGVQTF